MPPQDVWFVGLFPDFSKKRVKKHVIFRKNPLFGNKPGFGVAEIFQMEELPFFRLLFVILPPVS